MKTKQIFLTVLCLLLFAVMGNSQPTHQTPPSVQDREKSILRHYWNAEGGSMSAEVLLRDPEFRTALGVSEKYYQDVLTSLRNTHVDYPDDPQYQETMRERIEASEALIGSGLAMMGMIIPSNAGFASNLLNFTFPVFRK